MQAFIKGEKVTFDDVKRRLLLLCRQDKTQVPDRYYADAVETCLENASSISDVLVSIVPRFVSQYLRHTNEGLVYVREEKFIEWQNLITTLSPLFLSASYIFSEAGNEIGDDVESKREFFYKHIQPNFRHTALLSPRIIPMDKFFDEAGGYYDLHVHLSGGAESSAQWQGLLCAESSVLPAFFDNSKWERNRNNKSTTHIVEQNGILCTPRLLLELLEKAQKIRSELLGFAIWGRKESVPHKAFHPFEELFGKGYNECTTHHSPHEMMRYDALMIVLTLRYLCRCEKNSGDAQALLLYEYLLIQSFFDHLMIQTANEKGFEQFQRKMHGGLSSLSKCGFKGDFLQLDDNECKNIKCIESRISPQDNKGRMNKLLREVESGWKSAMEENAKIRSPMPFNAKCNTIPVKWCGIVVHFTKSARKSGESAYKTLRGTLLKRAKAIESEAEQSRNLPSSLPPIVGIDAAGSEFDAPPEVFAPRFRDLRKRGFVHFTYHAGEDFYHLLSGLRAIYEAVVFCGLDRGDRLGHASALGIDVSKWAKIVGDAINMPIGEWMDDLLFCYELIREQNITALETTLNALESEICSCYYKIYGKSEMLIDMLEAWRLRYLPILDKEKGSVDYHIEMNDNVKRMMAAYNDSSNRDKYDKLTNIKTLGFFDAEDLQVLQRALLAYLHEREIVIETTPTSNVRIGIHSGISTHQLFNWYKWHKEGVPLPPIVLGSDDPGVFSTNIHNEFAMVYCHLVYGLHWTRDEAMDFIKQLHNNAVLYTFAAPTTPYSPITGSFICFS